MLRVSRVFCYARPRTTFGISRGESTIKSLDHKRKRLLYQAKQRGMKENCILVGGFVEENISTLDDNQLEQLDKLLQEIDPALNEYICNVTPFPSHLDGDVARQMKEYANSNPLKYKLVDNTTTEKS